MGDDKIRESPDDFLHITQLWDRNVEFVEARKRMTQRLSSTRTVHGFFSSSKSDERDELLIDCVYEFVGSGAGSAPAHFRLCRRTYVVTCPLKLFRCLKFGAIKGNKETAYGTLEKIPRDFRANEGGYELTPLRSYEWFFLSVCSLQRAKFQPSCDLIFLNMIFNGLKISRGTYARGKKGPRNVRDEYLKF